MSSAIGYLRRGVASQGWVDPTTVDLANLDGRWVADDEVYSDAAVTTEIVQESASNGTIVKSWNKKEGNATGLLAYFAEGALVGVAPSGPTFTWNAQNGKPALYFNSTNPDHLQTLDHHITFPFSAYVCGRNLDTTNDTWFFMGDSLHPSKRYRMDFQGTGSPELQAWHLDSSAAASQHAVGNPGTTADSFGIVVVGDQENYVYHSSGSSSDTLNLVNPDGGGWASGKSVVGISGDSTPSQPMEGYMFELRIYSVAHSAATAGQVIAQMNSYWGV